MPANGLGHFDIKSMLIFNSISVCWRPCFGGRKPVPLCCRAGQPKNPLLSQDFAVHEVPSWSSLENLTSPDQELFQESFIGDSALAICHEYKPQVPIKRLSETPSARRACCPLGCPSRMFPRLIFTRSRKQNKSRLSFPTGLSSRCPTMELVTMRNILSTSLPSCIWLSRCEQLPKSRKPLQP